MSDLTDTDELGRPRAIMPVRIVEGLVAANEIGQAVEVIPIRYVEGDVDTSTGAPQPVMPIRILTDLVATDETGAAVPVTPVRVVTAPIVTDSAGRPRASLAVRAVGGGTPTPTASLSRVMPDGTTAWYTDQRGIVVGGNLFYSTSSGTISRGSTEIVRVAPDGKTTIWNVMPYAEVDDHNNASFLQLSDGRLIVFYQTHTDVRGTGYRISLAPAPNIKGWGRERRILPSGGASVSYTHPFLLNDGKVYLFRRNNIDGASGRRQQMCVTTGASLLAGTET